MMTHTTPPDAQPVPLETRGSATPILSIDLQQIRLNHHAICAAFPDALVYYAVKANPAPEVLASLTAAGCRFDVASLGEARAALLAGAEGCHLSYTTTVKKAADIKAAHELGVRVFAADSADEIDKIAGAAPGSRVFVRIAVDDSQGTAAAPFGSKFGCEPELAADLLRRVARVGLVPAGVSFHVGSQQLDVDAWEQPIAAAATICRQVGWELPLLNLGGGLPAGYTEPVPALSQYAAAINQSLDRHFGGSRPQLILEPGRAIAASAGTTECEVVQVTHRRGERWVYLDVGRYGGLAETENEMIIYPMCAPDVGGPLGPVIVAGPTADGDDILYQRHRPELPLALRAGDRVRIGCTGAYTATYSSVSFNGLPPLRMRVVDSTLASRGSR
ncbi:type III PLP-dependent enzyme [Nonomuraea sp. SYSU D8015]|uniref:type III PLP-dependent enzyme n=1 Tax=Nonomuraea sp. SYSU D8015 TaxID=2593644 RepID=UPI001CB7056D|nr:type III PLP-dependent enzyme [Nonomuraea sp. SYSU D8015]